MNKTQDDVISLRESFEKGILRTYEQRRRALSSLLSEIKKQENEILEALFQDLGKPKTEAYVSEIYFVLKEIKNAQVNVKCWMKPKKVSEVFFTWPSRSYVFREAFGIALIIAPWNYPFQLALAPLISAIAAGNGCVLKLSEHSPFTNRVVRSIIEKALGKEMVVICEGGQDATLELLSQSFDIIFYTGNSNFGKTVMEKAAHHLSPVILELGGKSPCIVDAGLDASIVSKRIMRGKLFNSGQTCVAPDFVCVPQKEHATYVEAFQKSIVAFYGEDPTSHIDYGKIIHMGHIERLQKLRLPQDEPLIVGQDRLHERKMAPTLLAQATWQSPSMQEELFGPILPILSYKGIDEVVGHLRKHSEPLSLYIFTQNRHFENEVLSAIPSGNVCINDVLLQLANPHLPFGGLGQSGMGRYHGKAGFDAFTYERSVMKRSLRFAPFEVTPPYRDSYTFLRKILK